MCCRKPEPEFHGFGLREQSCARICVIGEIGVGKTTLTERFLGRAFSPATQATVFVDYKILQLTLDDEEFSVQIFDTSGQERFYSLPPTYYRRTDGIIMVYSEHDRETLAKLENFWLREVERHATCRRLLVIGNQLDRLDEAQDPVSDDVLRALFPNFNLTIAHMSAKDDSEQRCRDVIDRFAAQVLIEKFDLARLQQAPSSSESSPDEPIEDVFSLIDATSSDS